MVPEVGPQDERIRHEAAANLKKFLLCIYNAPGNGLLHLRQRLLTTKHAWEDVLPPGGAGVLVYRGLSGYSWPFPTSSANGWIWFDKTIRHPGNLALTDYSATSTTCWPNAGRTPWSLHLSDIGRRTAGKSPAAHQRRQTSCPLASGGPCRAGSSAMTSVLCNEMQFLCL